MATREEKKEELRKKLQQLTPEQKDALREGIQEKKKKEMDEFKRKKAKDGVFVTKRKQDKLAGITYRT